MDLALVVKILFSFVVAGSWVTLATIISERFGSKIGGLVGNLPSNIVVSLFFMAWMNTPEFAAQAAQTVPFGMLIDSVFLFVLIAALKKYGNWSFGIAIIVWFLLAVPVVLLGYDDMLTGILAYMIVTVILFLVLEKKFSIRSVEKKTTKAYDKTELLGRAALAGGTVATTVAVASFAGPVWGGILSTFPAVMTSTMYLLTRSQGPDFARATGKVMLAASANIIFYGVAVYLTYPAFGMVIGTIVSYIAAAVFVVGFYPVLKKIR